MCVGIFSESFVVKEWVSQCGLGYMGRTPLIYQQLLLLLMLLLTRGLYTGKGDTFNLLQVVTSTYAVPYSRALRGWGEYL
jgi:hypothetical protein